LDEALEKSPQTTLEHWAVAALARWANVSREYLPSDVSLGGADWLREYGRILSPAWDLERTGNQLISIFSLVKSDKAPDESADRGPQGLAYVQARPLSLKTLVSGERCSREALWGKFVAKYGRLSKGALRFETFGHLYQKYAWAVPCTYGEKGVSLYEEFKALTAMVYASRCAQTPSSEFLLVGGDIPGIQGFVYTITSRGAAKALRGRSFFLQLLSDALVRSLICHLSLSWANVIYDAGGNFMVLAPKDVEEVLEEWRLKVNRRLLKHFGGDARPVRCSAQRWPGPKSAPLAT